jgi:AraC-like DNA-binding protein/mannose-6-phosphate isomerase-like protein (cupin superfamily)
MPAIARRTPIMITRSSIECFAADARYEVAAHRMTRQDAQERHGHRFLEIVVVERGEAVHITEGRTHRVRRGDVFILNPSRTHAYTETKSFALINILVRESFVRRLEGEMGVLAGFHTLFNLDPFPLANGGYSNRLRLRESSLKPVLEMAARIERLCQSPDPEGPVLCHAWGRLLIAHLAIHGGKINRDSRQNALARAIARVEQSIVEPLSLADIVTQAGMPERSFLRKFREATGHSPIQHQLHCRLRHACHLLVDTDLNITEVAMSCGFQDSNYFTRQFSRLHGQAPRDWRKARR